tara:strand:- start:697 stop:3228 length:2532 start_codon:yes stop_codon:yes gene_type:complete
MEFSINPYAPGREASLFTLGTTDAMAEEERKRREKEAALRAQAQAQAQDLEGGLSQLSPVEPTPIKETRTIDPATGEVKLSITGNERDLTAANANTPTYSGAKPVSPQQFNQQQYNASIGAQESGNRPNIGFHDRSKGTAYGQYGITDAAYQDARKLNPSLPQDKTQATPEQQTQAMNAFTQQNAKYLQGFGIEPTQNNLAAAHFVGAKGLNDFMTKKDEQGRPYISPQAQAANGGYEKAASILQSRLGGQAAPASGATNRPTAMPGQGVAVATGQGVQGTTSLPPNQPVSPAQMAQQPMPANQGIRIPGLTPSSQMDTQVGQQIPSSVQTPEAIQRFQTNQDNVDELVKMRNDTTIPEYLRKRSGERAYELMNAQFKEEQAKTKADAMLANNDQKGIAKAISSNPKDEEGSYLKMLLLGFISPQLAGQEAIKLGLGPTKWEDQTLTRDDGTEVGIQLKRRADGKIVGGEYHGGTPMTAEDIQLAQAGSLGKGVNVTRVDNMVDPNNPNRIITKQELSNGKQRFMSAGKRVTEGLENLVPATQFMEQENKRVNDAYTKLKGLVANPTDEQKLQALRAAGVSQSRIDTELGRPAGATQRVAPTQPITPQQVAQQQPPVAEQRPPVAQQQPPAAQPSTTTGYATSRLLQTPVQQPGEPNSTFKQREIAHDRQLKQAQKEAEGFQNSGVGIRDKLNGLQSIRQAVLDGNINAGPLLNTKTYPLPGVQDVFGRLYGSQDSENTEKLRSIISRDGLQGIKDSMGPAISNFDVQAWMKSNPISMNSSLPAIEKWLTKTHNAMWEEANMKRNEAIAIGAIGPNDYQLPPKIMAPEDNQVDTNNPLLKKKK